VDTSARDSEERRSGSTFWRHTWGGMDSSRSGAVTVTGGEAGGSTGGTCGAGSSKPRRASSGRAVPRDKLAAWPQCA
jgi:hypothetical protein